MAKETESRNQCATISLLKTKKAEIENAVVGTISGVARACGKIIKGSDPDL